MAIALYTFLILLALGLSSCARTEQKADKNLRALAPVQFALNQINKSDAASAYKSRDILFDLDSSGLKDQEYVIKLAKNKVLVRGGDDIGLMYGGLEIAEQLELYGEIKACSGSPFIKRRGIKFNIPLDARTPSYDDSGDAAQENIAEMWSWDFWEEFLDQMALHRYNVLSLWNPHPFPSMIKMEEYPEIALDDVYRTTLKPEGLENEWGDPGLVTSNVVANLEMVVQMSIDEKISFWQKVMQYAADRGIDIYWINWNICPNSVAPPVKPAIRCHQPRWKLSAWDRNGRRADCG